VTVAGKLVRDKIPDVIRASGVEPLTRVADDAEYARLLRDKLVEEVGEFLDSDDPAELADVFEVVLALAATFGVDRDGLEALRASKQAERGGFGQRIVWLGNA
jgi:predicted house-cleaning noncanonical NTP pyrophosphatase (MazG superfamily)